VLGKENKVVDALRNKYHVASMSVCKIDLRERVIKASVEDEKYAQVVAGLKEKEPHKKYEGYKLEEDGVLVFQGQFYISNNAKIKKLVLDEIHQMPYSSHPGYQKTITTTRKQYYWPMMKKEITKYITRCQKCQ